jgi:hypothetical protein
VYLCRNILKDRIIFEQISKKGEWL